jgi:hypothetical protein
MLKENPMNSEWLTVIKKAHDSGQIETTDEFDEPLVIEWKKADILSPDLANFKKSICDLAGKELAPIELQFLRTHPDAVTNELFLRPCAPLLENGLESVDWRMVEEKIQATIRQFYLTDLSKFGPEIIKPLMDDVYFFASVKYKNRDRICGFIMFAITPALPSSLTKLMLQLSILQSKNFDPVRSL